MDSPLLPTFKRKADVSSSPTGLMANMTLEPMSPGDSFMFSHQPSTSRLDTAQSSQTSHSFSLSARASTSAAPAPEAKSGKAPRFSLFAPNQGPSSRTDDHADIEDGARSDFGEISEEGEDVAGDETIHADNEQATDRAESSAARDDKLRESLYELRQMNEVFDGFLGALEAAKGHNERLAARVKETSRLLDMYTAILGQQEHTQDLLLNPRWTGAEDDLKALQDEEDQRAAAEAAALSAKEAARLAEEERQAELERAREQREAADARKSAPTRGGTRGRGGARGFTRGSGIPPPSSRNTTGAKPTTGIRKPSAGLGGRYADVKSSGYGPTKQAT